MHCLIAVKNDLNVESEWGKKNPLKYGCESFELFIQTVIVKL